MRDEKRQLQTLLHLSEKAFACLCEVIILNVKFTDPWLRKSPVQFILALPVSPPTKSGIMFIDII